MNNKTILIISDDSQLVTEVRDIIGQSFEFDLAEAPIERFVNGEACEELPPWILCDLRTVRRCEQLLGAQKFLHAAKKKSNLIGIVERGYPPEWAGVAARTLTTGILWPAEQSRLAEQLRQACPPSNARQSLLNGEHRRLAGGIHDFVTYSPSLFQVVEELEVAARHDFTVLLLGETGTGKTTLARLIHDLSPRRSKPFVNVACGTLPRETVDSELFGHVKGAFTGADKQKLGKFDIANGGTMLLDEIEVLELRQQAKLLRVIETGEFEPLGSNETRTTDSRLIVACNIDLEEAIAEHRFRGDLYFRLGQLKFNLPSLRMRRRDIVPLAIDLLQECCREKRISLKYVQPDLLELIQAYEWPGNIRELRNEMRRAVIFCENGVLTVDSISATVKRQALQAVEESTRDPYRSGLADEVGQAERDVIEQMLRSQSFNRAATARALGISRVTLYTKIRKHGIRMD